MGVRVNVLAPNTFPTILSTDQVAHGVEELAAGDKNGEVLVLDRGGQHYHGQEISSGGYG